MILLLLVRTIVSFVGIISRCRHCKWMRFMLMCVSEFIKIINTHMYMHIYHIIHQKTDNWPFDRYYNYQVCSITRSLHSAKNFYNEYFYYCYFFCLYLFFLVCLVLLRICSSHTISLYANNSEGVWCCQTVARLV